MIASTQITNTEIFAFIAVLLFKLLSRTVLYKKNSKLNGKITAKLYVVEIQNFVNNFETRKQSFISAFLICITLIILV